jgi:hypothetical protein
VSVEKLAVELFKKTHAQALMIVLLQRGKVTQVIRHEWGVVSHEQYMERFVAELQKIVSQLQAENKKRKKKEKGDGNSG